MNKIIDVYHFMLEVQTNTGHCPTHQEIADYFNVDTSTATRWVQKLYRVHRLLKPIKVTKQHRKWHVLTKDELWSPL